MDGLAQVQSRIAEIQAQFATQFSAPLATPASVSAATSGTTSSGAAFASALGEAQSDLGATSGVTAPFATPNAPGTGSATKERALVDEARKYLGLPYVWGGTNPKVGLDCSGLTQLVYKNQGIDIPRVSYDQAKAGRAVPSLDQARPGDLVFYNYSSSRPGIDHVALYIGGGKIIEAARPGTDIRVGDVGKPVVIRRILPEQAAAAPSSASPVGTAPTSGRLAGVPFGDLFVEAGAKHGVPAALLAAVAKTESAFNPRAVSPAGAQGLMQFMPATARGMGINPLIPAQAVDGAARYLAQHLRDFGSVDLALAAYNAGPGAVRKYNGIPPYQETRDYVERVNTAWKAYR